MLPAESQSPPSKASLKAWWNHFTSAQRAKKESEGKDEPVHTVFGKPLKESLHYASVQISTANANGELYVWGYIPVVVAKCGLYLKENATEVEGVFRVNGSNKRMRELQALFENPPRYGKSLDWKQSPYTPHDVASVFRRYLTQMPEPVIPYDLYHDFRDAMAKEPFNQEEVITNYKRLIRGMPRPNQYLLLYVLDLLSVFARKSDKNLMTATSEYRLVLFPPIADAIDSPFTLPLSPLAQPRPDLAVIFRPGLISHPSHEMSPQEHHLSQKVLEFLIAQQDWFMLDIPPPPQDEFGLGRPPAPQVDEDVTVFPSSDEEQSTGGGWKLVSKVARRKTMADRDRRHDTTVSRPGPVADPDLSPVNEDQPVVGGGESGATGVSRSRTLPSGRRGGSSSTEEREQPRLLKKQKRASSSQPSRTSLKAAQDV